MTEPTEYTPTIEQFLGFANTALIASGMPEEEAFRTTERVLAAHDAEVRASVVAEEPEWEYGWRSMWADGEEYEWQVLPSREAAEKAIRIHQDYEDNTDQIGGRLEFTLWKRTKSKAGPWVPVEQEPTSPRTFPNLDKRDDDGIGLLGGAPR